MNNQENEEFTEHLRGAVREAERLKYRPAYFKRMLDTDGGYETVKRILSSGKPSEGFTRLWELGRLDLTCEAVIVETKWRRYFDEDLLERSERLLRQMGYPFRRFEPVDSGMRGQGEPNLGGDNFVPPDVDERDFTARETALRPWQGQFRDALFECYGAQCCISGCSVPDALEAAHITPYLGEKSNHPSNGLVLRSDLHTLFDRYLFGIDPAIFRVTLSNALVSDPTYRGFDGIELAIPAKHKPSQRALGVHWQRFVERNR